MKDLKSDRDPFYELFSSFEEENPSGDLTRQTMSRILVDWSKKPSIHSSFFWKDYLWFLIGGAAIVVLVALFPSQLGIEPEASSIWFSGSMETLFSSVEKMGQLIHPLVWLVLMGGLALVFFDNLLNRLRKV